MNFTLLYCRDLSVIRSEVNKSARTVQGACMDLDKNMRSADSNLKLELEDERDKRVRVNIHLCFVSSFQSMFRAFLSEYVSHSTSPPFSCNVHVGGAVVTAQNSRFH